MKLFSQCTTVSELSSCPTASVPAACRNRTLLRITGFGACILVMLALLVSSGCGPKKSAKGVDLDPGPGATAAADLPENRVGIDQNSFASLLNREHFGFVTLDVPSIIKSEQTRDVPWESFFEGSIEYIGQPLFELAEINRMIWLVDAGMLNFSEGDDLEANLERRTIPGVVTVIEHRAEFDIKSLTEKLDGAKSVSRIEFPENADADKPVTVWGNQSDKIGIMLAGKKFLVMGSLESVLRIAKAKRRSSPLAEAASKMTLDKQINGMMTFGPIRPTLRTMTSMMRSFVPPEQQKMLDLPDVTESIQFQMDVAAKNFCEVEVLMEDEKNAAEITTQIRQTIRQIASLTGTGGGAQIPTAEMMIPSETTGLMQTLFEEVSQGGMFVENDGRKINAEIKQSETTNALVRTMVGDFNNQLALARRVNALKQIGKAFKAYVSEHESFPPAMAKTEQGKHPFSWRVAILPYVGQQKLFDQFKFDEPWDSRHNLEVAKQIPEEYLLFGTDNQTSLHILGGVGPFEGDRKIGFDDVQDDIGETALVVEAHSSLAEVWTKPGSLKIEDNQLPALGRDNENGILILMFEGDVKTARKSIGKKIVALFTANGDERVIDDKFFLEQSP